jgi:hypothetical protein
VRSPTKTVLTAFLSAWLALGPALLACTVPVFRYALERWHPDAYRVLIFHRGTLAEGGQAVVDWLRKVGAGEGERHGLEVVTVDLDAAPDEAALELWKAQTNAEPPWMVVLYPVAAEISSPVWAGRLSAAAARRLVESPARQEIARRLLAGDSAVWVLLECGKREKDDAAAKLLDAQLQELGKTLKLPDATEEGGEPGTAEPPVEVEVVGGDAQPAAPPLRIAFSMLRVKRTDPAEEFLVPMLLHTEEDLPKLDEPMAFPAYGRARVLPPFVGEGIHAENIAEACGFLAGPCACQIKAEAPGTDLLTLTPWDASLQGSLMTETELPPLVGVPEPAAEVSVGGTSPSRVVPPTPAAAADEGETALASSPLVRNLAVAAAAVLVGLGVATLLVLRRTRTSRD